MPNKTQWWLLVLPEAPVSFSQGVIITNRLLPDNINDSRKINYSDFAIPGVDYTPFQWTRNDNSKISFRVPVINKESFIGNSIDLQNVERTTSAQLDLSFTTEGQWRRNPLCIYSGFGTHRPPLPVVVEAATFEHQTQHTNPETGYSQFSYVSFTLRYVEDHALFRNYVNLRAAGAATSTVQSISRRGLPF